MLLFILGKSRTGSTIGLYQAQWPGMAGAGGFPALADQVLEFEYGVRILVRIRGNEQQEIAVRRYTQMVPVVWDQLVSQRIRSGLDRLAAIVGGRFGERN